MCMALALEEAGLKPEDVDYINTHGTATPKGGCLRVRRHPHRLRRPRRPPGHLLHQGSHRPPDGGRRHHRDHRLHYGHPGRCSAPPPSTTRPPDPECDLDCVPNTARKATVNIAMNNALGFGGQNASLIVGRYQG